MIWHTKVSFMKSGLRIGGYLSLLMFEGMGITVGILVLSEVIGIIEELVV
jgi:hypothetical protein